MESDLRKDEREGSEIKETRWNTIEKEEKDDDDEGKKKKPDAPIEKSRERQASFSLLAFHSNSLFFLSVSLIDTSSASQAARPAQRISIRNLERASAKRKKSPQNCVRLKFLARQRNVDNDEQRRETNLGCPRLLAPLSRIAPLVLHHEQQQQQRGLKNSSFLTCTILVSFCSLALSSSSCLASGPRIATLRSSRTAVVPRHTRMGIAMVER